mgnify:CR=1 FL=1
MLRNQGKTAGTWGIVGGKKEPTDSTLYEALLREIQEEAGLVLRDSYRIEFDKPLFQIYGCWKEDC